jgi:hypothetical protein
VITLLLRVVVVEVLLLVVVEALGVFAQLLQQLVAVVR